MLSIQSRETYLGPLRFFSVLTARSSSGLHDTVRLCRVWGKHSAYGIDVFVGLGTSEISRQST
jgi:hypothetical protein